MVTNPIQDRTAEFRAVLAQAQKKQASGKYGAQHQSLLTESQRRAANGSPNGDIKAGKRGARSEFARNAAQIGRGITGTMEKLERLAQRMCSLGDTVCACGLRFRANTRFWDTVARRKTLFDDRPVEIAELTYVIKQDLASLNSQISALQSLSKSQQSQSRNGGAEQEGEHNKNVGLSPDISTVLGRKFNEAPGSRPPARQTCRCWGELQRSPRSPHQEHSSLPLANRKLRLLRLSACSTLPRPSTICFSTVQHTYQVSNAAAWVPKHQPRHLEPRSDIFVFGAQ